MIIILTAFVSFCAGVIVLHGNPRRFPNQIFSFYSLFTVVWFLTVYQGATSEVRFSEIDTWFPWRRLNGALTAFFPWLVSLLKESIVTAEDKKWQTMVRSWPWFALGGLLAALSYTKSFIFVDPSSGLWTRGTAYLVYNILICSAFAFLALRSYFQMRGQVGLMRIETQFLPLNMAVTYFAVTAVASVSNLAGLPEIKRVLFFVFLGAFVLAAWATATTRVFNARQVLLSLGQRMVLTFFLSSVVYGLWHFSKSADDRRPLTLFISLVFCSAAAFWLDRKSRSFLDLGGERVRADTRRLVIDISLKEASPDKLISQFEAILRVRWNTEFATLLSDHGEAFHSHELELRKENSVCRALCELGWATPESLARGRKTSPVDDLQRFITAHRLGIIAVSPRGSHSPSVIIALGHKNISWPYTYPEIERLQDIAELMDNILTRSRLAAQAALTAKMEHLAMMSRGLAHDLKNLITPISSFLIHTDEHFPPDSPEAEVHAAARRSVRIMTDYVREALFFSERLAPNFQAVDLARLFHTVSEITASRAAHRRISVSFSGEYPASLVADTVLLQRMLGNLVSNAIDASRPGQAVTISVSQPSSTKVRFQVKDEGSGIAPENLSRIFDPYFTTKEFGDDVRGFGLGLTICQKIAHLHGGTIFVDSEVGRGTTVSVDLPSAPTPLPGNEPLLDGGSNSRHSNLPR